MTQFLVEAAQQGRVHEVQQLLDNAALHGGAKDLAMQDSSAALRAASMYGHADCVALLIPHSDLTARKCSALRMAAHNNHAACVELLLPGSEDFILHTDGEVDRFIETLRILIEDDCTDVLLACASLVGKIPAVDQSLILHMAVRRERKEFIDAVLPLCDWNGMVEEFTKGIAANPGFAYLEARTAFLQKQTLLQNITPATHTVARKM